ncbi:MAG: hypothetical protein NT068_02325 [Candidatus Nomurabacteria bacterium]|nr:hypothetical protein [Candidatus Nomurabacteria bacterium]
MRFLIPIILILISVAGFFMFLNPNYAQIKLLTNKITSYNTALTNSKSLENERDKLATKYNSIDTENLKKLSVMLPDNVDNIRLILEIEKIAAPYGMVLKDVKYSAVVEPVVTTKVKLAKTAVVKKDYGDWDLEFSTSGTYTNFIKLLKDLEHNLRIVDIASIDFSSDVSTAPNTGASLSTSSPDTYKFNFKIKTYWLKN